MELGRLSLALRRALRLRCPRCGDGALFAGPFRMAGRCPACGLVFEREAGYFIGAIYINYGLTVGPRPGRVLSARGVAGPVTRAGRSAVWGTFTVLFPLWSFRYSKALWLALDHLVDPAGGGPG